MMQMHAPFSLSLSHSLNATLHYTEHLTLRILSLKTESPYLSHQCLLFRQFLGFSSSSLSSSSSSSSSSPSSSSSSFHSQTLLLLLHYSTMEITLLPFPNFNIVVNNQ
ncbi:hypothetical protein RIF29_16981 [Crotalaria pallida]|uniref:Uncharacterized protein n=1 Tax=Crotalaria pallida TaxID=3830 RepID=A0AAN9FHG3_CROPI